MRYGKWGVSFSREETQEVGDIARRLGGYEQMLRLERELADYQRRGIAVRMTIDADGRRQLVPQDDAAAVPETAIAIHEAPVAMQTPPFRGSMIGRLMRLFGRR